MLGKSRNFALREYYVIVGVSLCFLTLRCSASSPNGYSVPPISCARFHEISKLDSPGLALVKVTHPLDQPMIVTIIDEKPNQVALWYTFNMETNKYKLSIIEKYSIENGVYVDFVEITRNDDYFGAISTSNTNGLPVKSNLQLQPTETDFNLTENTEKLSHGSIVLLNQPTRRFMIRQLAYGDDFGKVAAFALTTASGSLQHCYMFTILDKNDFYASVYCFHPLDFPNDDRAVHFFQEFPLKVSPLLATLEIGTKTLVLVTNRGSSYYDDVFETVDAVSNTKPDVNYPSSTIYDSINPDVNYPTIPTYNNSNPNANYPSSTTYNNDNPKVEYPTSTAYNNSNPNVKYPTSTTYNNSSPNIKYPTSTTYNNTNPNVNYPTSTTYNNSTTNATGNYRARRSNSGGSNTYTPTMTSKSKVKDNGNVVDVWAHEKGDGPLYIEDEIAFDTNIITMDSILTKDNKGLLAVGTEAASENEADSVSIYSYDEENKEFVLHQLLGEKNLKQVRFQRILKTNETLLFTLTNDIENNIHIYALGQEYLWVHICSLTAEGAFQLEQSSFFYQEQYRSHVIAVTPAGATVFET